MRSANLVIMITDIAGYTATTARHTRAQNEQLIATHNTILLPLVNSFGGKHIKSIGDSLLIIFDSPTDALLCAMSMQDSLFIHNKDVSFDSKLQIRIAINLGEVRLSENDVFGDPVNMTSRIEGITPPGEIYFSESVYITMNRAEVCAELVGEKKFSGATETVKIFRVPSFTTRILESNSIAERNQFDATLPFGGVHLRQPKSFSSDTSQLFRTILASASIIMVMLVIGLASFRYFRDTTTQPPTELQHSKSPSEDTLVKKIEHSNDYRTQQSPPDKFTDNKIAPIHQPQNHRDIEDWKESPLPPPYARNNHQIDNRMVRPPILRPQNRPIRSFRDRTRP